MSQDAFGHIGFFEDFQALTDDDDQTISDATPVRWNDVLIVPIAADVAQNVLVDESGGVITFSAGTTAGDGVCLIGVPMQPSGNGTISMGVRFKYSAVTDMQIFVGWQETADRDETVKAFTLSTTTLTANSVGQVVGMYYDTAADTDDWRMMGASDGSAFTTELGALGTRAQSTPVLDEWMVVRVEIDASGRARCFYGDSSTDVTGTGLNRVDSLAAGSLDEDAVYHPVVMLAKASTGDPDMEADYFWAKGHRDWAV